MNSLRNASKEMEGNRRNDDDASSNADEEMMMTDEFNRSMDDINNMSNTQNSNDSQPQSKKPRLVFTDIQRRTLQAIFKETKRPSKEMQMTIAQQLGLEVATVSNFFMNARRRSMDKWKEEDDENSNCSSK